MNKILTFYQSTIGKKFVAAVTGALLFGFVVMHMAGNLKAFAGVGSDGVHKLDHYAHFLHTIGADMAGEGTVLWGARIGLLIVVLLHIVTVAQLTMLNRKSRPVRYAKEERSASTFASRSMAVGGSILLIFIIFHILHFTTGDLHFDGFEHGKVYANVHSAFQHWYLVAFYLLAMFFLGLHLFHGLWSLCQTLGIDNPDRNDTLRKIALAASVVVAVGFASVPLGVFAGVLGDPPSGQVSVK